MAKYPITIKETLSRTVEIEADSVSEAVELAKGMYRHGYVILDADDFREAAFEFATTE